MLRWFCAYPIHCLCCSPHSQVVLKEGFPISPRWTDTVGLFCRNSACAMFQDWCPLQAGCIATAEYLLGWEPAGVGLWPADSLPYRLPGDPPTLPKGPARTLGWVGGGSPSSAGAPLHSQSSALPPNTCGFLSFYWFLLRFYDLVSSGGISRKIRKLFLGPGVF